MDVSYVCVDDPHLDKDLIAFDQSNASGPFARTEAYWKGIDCAWKCICKTEIVGLIAWKIEREDDATEWVYITDVSVDEQFRRQGIGKKLIFHVIADCKKRNLWRFYLNVVVSNTIAQNLYKSCGFSITGKVKGYYLEDWPWIDEDVPDDDDHDAYEMERQSSRVERKERRPGFKRHEQTSKEVRFGTTDYELYAIGYCCRGGGYYGWKIDYDDYGLIECHEYDERYICRTDAFRAVERYFETNKHALEREAIRRKRSIQAGAHPGFE